MVRLVLLFAALLIVASSASARDGGDSSRTAARADTVNTASLLFDKLLSNYRWNGALVYRETAGPLAYAIDERFTSTLIKLGRSLITDEQHLSVAARYGLSERLRASAELSSFVLSDDRGIGISNASEYLLVDGITVEPLIGFRSDNQIDEHDRGASYLLRATGRDLDYNGYRTQFRGRLQVDRLDPRTIESDSAVVSVRKTFFPESRNAILFRFTRNRRDFYFTPDAAVRSAYGVSHNIESRTENNVLVGDSLEYEVVPGALLTFQGSVLARHIGRETRYRTASDDRLATDIDEMRLEGSAEAAFAPGRPLSGMFRFLYQERDERHTARDDPNYDAQVDVDAFTRLEEEKNNHAQRTSLAATMTALVSSRDTIGLAASGTILRYDTQSDENLDDRDELWYILNLSYARRMSRSLTVGISADANLTHLVYLASARSADNTWNRIFRVSPRAVYSPGEAFFSSNRFEVLANYTVYDFEYLSGSTRSFSFRQFAWVDSSELRLTKRFSANWYNYLRFYERGDFRWDEFAERPVNAFEDKTLQGTFSYILREGLLFSVGIRYFSSLRFGYIGSERVLERFFKSVGPTTQIRWTAGPRTDFSVSGWFEHQTMTDQPDHRSANMTMSLYVRI
jgi:hypothetical protein